MGFQTIAYKNLIHGVDVTETMYLLDNSTQLDYAIEDFEYTKWLDPDPEVAAYPRDSDTITSPYTS